MREAINAALKEAMKSGDKLRTSTLRLINAAIKDRDIDARGNGRDGGITPDEVMQLLQKMIKQRQDSAKVYEEAGRADLADQEREEIKVIQGFLPQPLSAAETEAAIDAAIAAVGAQGLKDMGKVVGELKAKFPGRMDFAAVGPKVKAKLG